jgi:hypothetical protein
MSAVVLLCAGLLGFTPPDRSEYRAAAARAGKDARAHLKLAVWCEAHGMDAERLEHLAMAMAIDPQNAAARGLMGLVAYGGKWLPPDKVGETVNADEALAAKLAEYEAKRQATPETAEAQWQLGLWCEKNGLNAEAMAHFTTVTQIDSNRAVAWRKLGCERSHGRWINAEQAAAERAEDQAQLTADMHWEPILRKWRDDLLSDGSRSARAIAAMKAVTDPRAVPSIHRVLARGNRAEQEMAALMFIRIPCAASSHALVGLALYDSWPEGRAFAIRELKRRDPREYIDEIVGLLHRPYAWNVTRGGPQGDPATLVIDGDRSQIKRVYQLTPTAGGFRRRAIIPGGPDGNMAAIGPTGPVVDFQRYREIPLVDPPVPGAIEAAHGRTQRTIQQEVAIVEAFNDRIRADNRRVAATLTEITDEKLGDDDDAWRKWWNDQVGLRYERIESRYKPTTVQYVPIRFEVHHACFAAGTPVPTLTGPRPIESLKVGDVVLSQDTGSGVLSFQPIVGVHHNPPAKTVRVRTRDATVVSTPVHRFWRAGRGWAMARDLNPGDVIRIASGRTDVIEIRPDVIQPVYNLDVARNHSFFVGSANLLVRDNSLPPAMFTPFDAEPSLAAIAEEHAAPPDGQDEASQASKSSEGASERGSIWDTQTATSALREAANPAAGTPERGLIGESAKAPTVHRRASMLGPHPVAAPRRSPR